MEKAAESRVDPIESLKSLMRVRRVYWFFGRCWLEKDQTFAESTNYWALYFTLCSLLLPETICIASTFEPRTLGFLSTFVESAKFLTMESIFLAYGLASFLLFASTTTALLSTKHKLLNYEKVDKLFGGLTNVKEDFTLATKMKAKRRTTLWLLFGVFLVYSFCLIMYINANATTFWNKLGFNIFSGSLLIILVGISVSMVVVLSSCAEIMLISNTLQLLFESVHTCVKRLLSCKGLLEASKIFQVRKFHADIVNIVNVSNSFWKYYLFLYYLSCIPINTLITRGALFENLRADVKAVLLGWCIGNFSLLVLMSLQLGKVKDSACLAQDDLFKVSSDQLNESGRYEVQCFLHRLSLSNVGFTCWNMFIVTQGTLTAVVGAILSYMFATKG